MQRLGDGSRTQMQRIPFPIPAGASTDNVPGLLTAQVAWLVHGGTLAKRVFTLWLLDSRIRSSSGTVLILSQARQAIARHISQLDQLLPVADEEADAPCRGIQVLLHDASRGFHDGNPTPEFFEALRRVCTSFAIACGSASETAMVAERVDLAAVLASWAAASRAVLSEIDAQHPVAA